MTIASNLAGRIQYSSVAATCLQLCEPVQSHKKEEWPEVHSSGETSTAAQRSKALFQHQVHPGAIAKSHDSCIEKEHLIECFRPEPPEQIKLLKTQQRGST